MSRTNNYLKRNLNLKLNLNYDNLSRNKINEIYSIIGNSKTNNGKISIISNEIPLSYVLTTDTKVNLSKFQNISLSNKNINNPKTFSSFSSDKKIPSLKKNKKSFNNSFNPIKEQSINKISLNKKKKNNNQFNKAYYKGELQTLNTLLFGYRDSITHRRIFSNVKNEDPFYSLNNINSNRRERLLSGGNLQLELLMNKKTSIPKLKMKI